MVKPDGMIYVGATQQLAGVDAGSYGDEPAVGIGLPTDLMLHKHLRAGAVHVHLLLREDD